MANKRVLKRSINLICDELLAECIAASLYGGNRETAQTLFVTSLRLRDDFISRISHPEPGMPAKRYFDALKNSFVAQVSDIADQLNAH